MKDHHVAAPIEIDTSNLAELYAMRKVGPVLDLFISARRRCVDIQVGGATQRAKAGDDRGESRSMCPCHALRLARRYHESGPVPDSARFELKKTQERGQAPFYPICLLRVDILIPVECARIVPFGTPGHGSGWCSPFGSAPSTAAAAPVLVGNAYGLGPPGGPL